MHHDRKPAIPLENPVIIRTPLSQGHYLLDGRTVSAQELCNAALALDRTLLKPSTRPGMDYEVRTHEAAEVLRAHGHTCDTLPQ